VSRDLPRSVKVIGGRRVVVRRSMLESGGAFVDIPQSEVGVTFTRKQAIKLRNALDEVIRATL
jgi:hypothetical protein